MTVSVSPPAFRDQAQVLDRLDAAIELLPAPRLERIKEATPPPSPMEELRRQSSYRIQVTLVDEEGERLTRGIDREEGVKFRLQDVVTYRVNPLPDSWIVECDGTAARRMSVQLKDRGWEFVAADTPTREFAVDWEQAETHDSGPPYRLPVPGTPKREETLTLPAFAEPPRPPQGEAAKHQLGVPGRLFVVLESLTRARAAIDDGLHDLQLLEWSSAALRPGGRPAIRAVLARCQQAALAELQAAEPILHWVDAELAPTGSGRGSGVRSVSPALRERMVASSERLRTRLAQYQGEAQWWLAEFVNPNRPDRQPALEALASVGGDRKEAAAQIRLFSEIARDEERLAANLERAILSGEYDQKPIRVQEVVHTFKIRIPVRRVRDNRCSISSPGGRRQASEKITSAPSQISLDGSVLLGIALEETLALQVQDEPMGSPQSAARSGLDSD